MTERKHLLDHLQALLQQGRNPGDHLSDIFREFGCTRAVMVVDSVGFSRTAKEQGIIHFLSQMVRAREIIGPTLAAKQALDVRFEADNAYAVFEHPNAAIKAADAIHQAIADSGVMLRHDEPYSVCIGIGYGELLDAGAEGFFGDEMNLASKLGEDIADGAETLITDKARAAADDALLEHFVDEFATIAGMELRYGRKPPPGGRP